MRLSVALVSLVAATAAWSPTAAATETAAPPGGGTAATSIEAPPHTAAAVRALAAKTAVHDVRVLAERAHPGGFVQASVDAKTGDVTVFWHGELPGDVRAKAAGGIEFVQVPYSLDTLRAEAKRISAEYPQVVSAGPSADYRGLDVRVDETKAGEKAITGTVPVRVVPAKGGFVPLRRDADGMPYSGGTLIINHDTGDLCSTGFSVTLQPAGNEGITTAAHCEGPGPTNAWGDPYRNQIYGYQSRRDYITDGMLLVGAGKDYGPVVYNGGWQSGSGYWVEDWYDPLVGEYACDSGGLSGEVCDNVVVQTDTYIDGRGPGYITESYHFHTYGSAGPGDSGGASYTFGSFGVIASGTIVAGLLESAMGCSPDAYPDPARPCYSVVFHTNIEGMAQALTMTPQTR